MSIHTDVVTFLVYNRKLAETASYVGSYVTQEECPHEHISWHGSRGECQDCGDPYVESGSVYPDLPCDGWLWYDESAGTTLRTDPESR